MCVILLLLLAVEAHVLLSDQFSIEAVFLQQHIMAALLLYHPFVEDKYTIGLLYNTYVVGNQQHGAVVGLVQQSLVHLLRTIVTWC